MTQNAPDPTFHARKLPPSTKRLILLGTLLSLFLAALDQTIVATALPEIVKDLDGLKLFSWVTTAYLLASTALVPIYGKLSDIHGRKPVLLFGIVLFLVGSALCGAAGESFLGSLFGGGIEQLVVFRGIQGLGAAAVTSVAFTVIAEIFEPAEQSRYQGLFGAVFGLASVMGPLLGGLLTDTVSWRWVFYVNLPIGLLALAFIAARMPVLAHSVKSTIDYAGAILIVLFTVPLLLALTWGADQGYGWSSPTVQGLLGLSLVSLLVLLLVESRHPSPILPLNLFRNPTYLWSVTGRFLLGAGFLGAILFLTLYLVNVQGVSATAAGTATIPLTVGLIVGSIVAGQVAARLGHYKGLLLGGVTLMVLGFWWLSTLQVDTAYSLVIARMVVLGLGVGSAAPLYNLAIQNAVKPTEIGAATSSGQFFQQMGSTLGTALFGTLLSVVLASQFTTHMTPIVKHAPAEIRAQLGQLGTNEVAGESSGSSGFDAKTWQTQAESDIKQAFDQQHQQISQAVQRGDRAQFEILVQKAALPPALQKDIRDLRPFRSPQDQAAVLRQLKAHLNQEQTSALQQIRQVSVRVREAMKLSFTQAITRIYAVCLAVAVLCLLATLMLPNRKLSQKRDESLQDQAMMG